jgi:hypothetical protein
VAELAGTWRRAALLLAVAVLAGCTPAGEGEAETEALGTTETAPTTDVAPTTSAETTTATAPETEEPAVTTTVEDEVARLICTSGRKAVYQAPSLHRAQGQTRSDPTGLFWDISVRGSPSKGWNQLEKVGCRELTVLGAAAYDVVDAGGAPVGKWVFVVLERDPSVRGWVYVAAAAGAVDWSALETVEPETLLPGSGRRPDLAVGPHSQPYQAGDPCPLGHVDIWDLIVSNGGAGLGPSKLGIGVDPQYSASVKEKPVDISRVVNFTFARALAPGESIVLRGVPYNTQVALDPKNRVDEADEGNNAIHLPTGELLTCE